MSGRPAAHYALLALQAVLVNTLDKYYLVQLVMDRLCLEPSQDLVHHRAIPGLLLVTAFSTILNPLLGVQWAVLVGLERSMLPKWTDRVQDCEDTHPDTVHQGLALTRGMVLLVSSTVLLLSLSGLLKRLLHWIPDVTVSAVLVAVSLEYINKYLENPDFNEFNSVVLMVAVLLYTLRNVKLPLMESTRVFRMIPVLVSLPLVWATFALFREEGNEDLNTVLPGPYNPKAPHLLFPPIPDLAAPSWDSAYLGVTLTCLVPYIIKSLAIYKAGYNLQESDGGPSEGMLAQAGGSLVTCLFGVPLLLLPEPTSIGLMAYTQVTDMKVSFGAGGLILIMAFSPRLTYLLHKTPLIFLAGWNTLLNAATIAAVLGSQEKRGVNDFIKIIISAVLALMLAKTSRNLSLTWGDSFLKTTAMSLVGDVTTSAAVISVALQAF